MNFKKKEGKLYYGVVHKLKINNEVLHRLKINNGVIIIIKSLCLYVVCLPPNISRSQSRVGSWDRLSQEEWSRHMNTLAAGVNHQTLETCKASDPLILFFRSTTSDAKSTGLVSVKTIPFCQNYFDT